MKLSLKCNGQTMADLSAVSIWMPAAENVTRGSPLMTIRRLFATQPDSPAPSRSVEFSSRGASTPAANRHFNVSVSALCRNSEQPDHGTSFDSFDEISAIVSSTPRLVPIDCAIS